MFCFVLFFFSILSFISPRKFSCAQSTQNHLLSVAILLLLLLLLHFFSLLFDKYTFNSFFKSTRASSSSSSSFSSSMNHENPKIVCLEIIQQLEAKEKIEALIPSFACLVLSFTLCVCRQGSFEFVDLSRKTFVYFCFWLQRTRPNQKRAHEFFWGPAHAQYNLSRANKGGAQNAARASKQQQQQQEDKS